MPLLSTVALGLGLLNANVDTGVRADQTTAPLGIAGLALQSAGPGLGVGGGLDVSGTPGVFGPVRSDAVGRGSLWVGAVYNLGEDVRFGLGPSANYTRVSAGSFEGRAMLYGGRASTAVRLGESQTELSWTASLESGATTTIGMLHMGIGFRLGGQGTPDLGVAGGSLEGSGGGQGEKSVRVKLRRR